ncbi:ExbD/TolR family protein [Pseudoxanthomonas mexicana]|uniref:ExbD/TolR family protein n=1 Tax=Pseudoxanthomonas mexicana TaxID=128785 RepID=UPI00398AB73D
MAFSDVAVSDSTYAPARPLAGINITPLVDVLLVLLIIFMVTAPMLSRPLPVLLPAFADRAPPIKPQQLDLLIAADGGLRLNDRALDWAQLQQRLEETAAADPGALLRLRAMDDADYQQLVAAIALARRSGLTQVSLSD